MDMSHVTVMRHFIAMNHMSRDATLRGFRQGLTQTDLYSHRSGLEA